MQQCKILAPGVVVNPNGTVLVTYVIGEYPLTGEETPQQMGAPSKEALIQSIVELEQTLVAPDSFVLLALASYVKADPFLAVPGAAEGATAAVNLTGQTDPITFG